MIFCWTSVELFKADGPTNGSSAIAELTAG